jgi:hypothetical protein
VRYPRMVLRTSARAGREIRSTSAISALARAGSRLINFPANSDFKMTTDNVCPEDVVQIARDALAFRHLGQMLDLFLSHLQLRFARFFSAIYTLETPTPMQTMNPVIQKLAGIWTPGFQPDQCQKDTKHHERKRGRAEHKGDEDGIRVDGQCLRQRPRARHIHHGCSRTCHRVTSISSISESLRSPEERLC